MAVGGDLGSCIGLFGECGGAPEAQMPAGNQGAGALPTGKASTPRCSQRGESSAAAVAMEGGIVRINLVPKVFPYQLQCS